MNNNRRLHLSFVPLFAIFFTFIFWASSPNNATGSTPNLQMGTPQPTKDPNSDNEESWLTLPELAPNASQADVGAEIYILVCQDCHGDKGQGLTDEWRESWGEEEQNCWQSKCHATTHPEDGFILPKFIPAIIGPTTLLRFQTAADLYQFIDEKMPWHNPGSLTNEEYWQLTAFLLRENDALPNESIIDHSEALNLFLHPTTLPPPSPTPPNESQPVGTPLPWPWIPFILLTTLFLFVLALWFVRKKEIN